MNQEATLNLKRAGLKVTLPRMHILEILEKSDTRHLSAEDVYRILLGAGAEVGLATVYRVLTQFEAAGLITKHHFDGGTAVYELNNNDDHNHIVCVKTGVVEEFTDALIEERVKRIAEERGYQLTDYKLTLYGISPQKPE